MTKEQIDEILDRVRTWPIERQEDAAAIPLQVEEQESGIYELSEEELSELDEALAEADRGEFATDEEMKAVFDRHRSA